MLLYVTENFIDENSTLYERTEESPYIVENVYNGMPSSPYRTETGEIGAVGVPEYICVEFDAVKDITFCGLFNHNLTTLEAGADSLLLKGCDSDCATCVWDAPPACTTNLELMACAGTQPIANFANLYSKISCTPGHKYWRLEIIDTLNPANFLQIGELVLGEWQSFHRGHLSGDDNWVRLSPGRADGPMYFMGNQRTRYGQDWTAYYSKAEHFTLTFTNINDPCIVDEIHAFLDAVQQAGGTFIIIPDDARPFCYYVVIENLKDYARRLIYPAGCSSCGKELREWKIELKTLTEGIILL